VIVGKYQTLWAELAELRGGGTESAPLVEGQPVNPLRADPYQAFAGYATATLGADDLIALAPGASNEAFDSIAGSPLVAFARAINPSVEEIRRILDGLKRNGSRTAGEIARDWPEPRRSQISRSLLWLAKLGLVRIKRKR
jgi:hypothetical protein